MSPSASVIRLIYASRWTDPDKADNTQMLDDILQASVRNNAAAGITGLLLYRQGWFLQALEGELDQVDNAFDRIRRDTRHLDVRIVSDELAFDRAFGDWTMCANRVDQVPPHVLAELGLSGPFDPAALDADKALALLTAAADARRSFDQAA